MKKAVPFKSHIHFWLPLLILICLMLGLVAQNAQAQLSLPGQQQRLSLSTGAAGQHIFQTPHVKAELMAYAPQGVQSGQKVWFGVLLQHEPEWHTYWQNPGDIGLPTKLNWMLPDGVQVGAVQWPVPKIFPIDEQLLNYGYDGSVLLTVPVDVAQDFNAPDLTIQLDISWLVCRVECIPESGQLSLTIPAQQTVASSAALFDATLEQLPQPDSQVTVELQINSEPAPGALVWKISHLPEWMQGKTLQLLPEDEGVMTTSGPLFAEWQQGTWNVAYALTDFRLTEPATMRALLKVADVQGFTNEPQALIVEAQVQGVWPGQEPLTGASEEFVSNANTDRVAVQAADKTAGVTVTSAKAGTTFWSALLLAFLGGLLLNLMPCVFPVLSIKALTFAQAGSRRMHIISGLAYGVGVIATMLVLAGIFLVLRSASSGLGWGFQLQSPIFVSTLAVLFTLIALNLLGAYELRVFLPSAVSELRGKTPAMDALFSGFVSVLVATPCTAPAMGTALGATLTMSTWQAMMVFLMLGVGLALPLVLIACIPVLANCLPKPGRWMETFRKTMAFPMLATVLWLVWVIGLQTSLEGAMALLGILLCLSLLVWAFGHTTQYKLISGGCLSGGQKIGLILCLLLFLGITAWLAPALTYTQTPNTAQAQEGPWQPWSQAKVEELLAQDKVVFVDFTAAWCMTCQMNKRTTLRQPEVIQAFADKGVVLLEADWTQANPEIGKELERLERNGLPVYVFYQKDKAPVILPEILTPAIVKDALNMF